MFQDKIWVVDEAKLYPKLIQAMSEGKAVIHDGVAYWAEGSGSTGVIQHLPFKETAVQSVEEALKLAQATTVIATAVSTGIILAAIVVQTRYLAGKLDKIQETVDVIAKDVHAQNIVFYMDKITEYVGHVEAARTLLKDRSLAGEIRDVAIPLLMTLAGKRNQVLSFVDNILSFARSSKDVTPRHFELIANFTQMMLDLMPFGIHVEYLLSSRIGKLRLAEQVLLDGAERFSIALECYRGFMNDLHRDLVRGQLGDRANVYQSIESRAMKLIKSEENKILLSLPTGRAAPLLQTV
ncbi:hypothetical protein [Pseudomonas sp. D(2018)]|uniref:hypothetical protein n=1 Tax=Pseudomonas sp. D(2018) TaxID=2502238 RepID=UPI0010F8766C|nr:hypothetical protein [Pseudomonas sp. D(2018)]